MIQVTDKYKKRLETDKAFARHEFDRWLRDYFEEDSLEIFMGLKKVILKEIKDELGSDEPNITNGFT